MKHYYFFILLISLFFIGCGQRKVLKTIFMNELNIFRTGFDGKGCKNVFDKYSIPDIEYGFYYFKDRTPEETDDRKDDTDLNNRSSYNFTVALFDVYKSTIYYYELDT